MIDEIIKVHDNYQFEIKSTYKTDEKLPVTKYCVETYVFIPKSLGIEPSSYSKTKFYEDVKTYIRLKTPSLLLKNTYGKDSPLEKLEKCVENLTRRFETGKLAEEYEYRIKMLCSIIKSSLRDELAYIKKNITDKDICDTIENFLHDLEEFTSAFRALSRKIKVASTPQYLINLYQCADEYISIISNEARHELYELLEKSNFNKKSEHIKETIIQQAKKEIKYREDCNYLSIPDEESDNETMVFRRSALKKLMGRILFLTRKTKPEGFLVEQIMYGLAAGLAAAIATSFALYYRNRIQEFTFFAFLALVIVYIFKDRIKDILKMYFAGMIRKYFADKKTTIYTNLGHKIGTIRESFSFLEERDIPQKIKSARAAEFLSDADDGSYGEDVFLYRKEITLISKRFKDVFPDFHITGINDITRFNIMHFTRRMDNPEEDIFIPKKNGYIRILGSRVYHINIIINNIEKIDTSMNKVRVILNRNGIKRIETF